MYRALLIAAALSAAGTAATAQDEGRDEDPNKAFVVEEVVNNQPGFMIRVAVDKPDRVYYEGDTISVSMISERDCYIYLIYYDAEDNITCLFPNEYQKENFIKADTQVQVPAKDDNFVLRTSRPFGKELLQVIATIERIDLFEGKNLKSRRMTPLKLDDIKKALDAIRRKGAIVQEKPAGGGQDQDQDQKPSQEERINAIWAEARIDLTTKPREQAQVDKTRPKKSNRVAVCIGLSDFKDPKIPKLRVCHQDAQRMAQALKEKCGVQDVILLQNQQATLKAIEDAIFGKLVARTRPGDTVFIYFSGHGGRCADTNGDEQDGFDEYLVPYDGVMNQPETMLLDDQFARWIRELDGRRVCILLDNCYSGGSSKGMKGLEPTGGAPASAANVDFVDGELSRAKDLGQKGTVVLAASQADQIAWEMPTGEGSVLTFYLLESLNGSKADSNGDGRLTTGELYGAVKDAVQSYVQQEFKADQVPVFIDNANDQIIFKP